ncbi:DUF2291 family protein [Pelagicoccus sp. SDUM812005]|uniref:DUF2291 family protein n=1 Tax=Pelagicoccus sp. SDUM812005 TaxID=3041257 RepID=UPI00280CE8B1|nr:DUF2291 family protein [Pelagicoccus sp. SDUM812005]MDQ8179352.1 DUF2291 family protein [Pelagicoccus sp. SDUM812005]
MSYLSSKFVRWGGSVALLAILWLVLPPFRIVSLDENGKLPSNGKGDAAFDAGEFADRFWEETLVSSMDSATPLSDLLEAIDADLASAKRSYGEQKGEGAPVYFYAGGEGTVVEIKGRRATLQAHGARVNLLIAPPVFGNTVRDGTGLLSVNELPGLEEFNAVSAALNKKVELEVMSVLKDSLSQGVKVRFVGCSKVPEALSDGANLEFTPLRVEIAE